MVGRYRGFRAVSVCLMLVLLSACAFPPPKPRETSAGHIGTQKPPEIDIPAPVQQTPFLPAPKPAPPLETYTVVVHDVPVRELLFALARDAEINVDIHPDIEGLVTLNAVDQTLPQILERISRQVDLRYEFKENSLAIFPDSPFLKTYKVDYVNMARESKSTINLSTQVVTSDAAGGGGGSDSTTSITNTSDNRFWQTLEKTIQEILSAGGATGEGSVISNRESGVIVVRATERQHEQIRVYLDQVLANAERQVLIEATIVEVTLSDRYQAGIDWQRLATDAGFTFAQTVTGGTVTTAPFFLLEYANSRKTIRNPDGSIQSSEPDDDLSVTARLLKEFGDSRVLSSPKLMVLNNQTAVIKVVDNRVYFEIDAETTLSEGQSLTTFDTTAKTVPVGIVMNVTPQIDARDSVTLNLRPTISRILGFVNDPNPSLADAGVVNPVPEIQTREMESVLKVSSGQIAILGGLMQDDLRVDTDGVPVLSDIEGLGEVFKFRDNEFTKSELVIFLRPTVIRTASVAADLADFRQFLPENLPEAKPVKSPTMSTEENPQ